MTDNSTKNTPLHRVVVGAFVFNYAGQVLLGYRTKPTSKGWCNFGGHVEIDETPADAVRRECAEELGIRISGSVHLLGACRSRASVDYPPIVLTYAVLPDAYDGKPANLEPDRHTEICWFEIERMYRNFDLMPTMHAALDDDYVKRRLEQFAREV